MPSEAAVDPALRNELEAVYALYASLVCNLDSDNGIGGKLLYAGELDRDGCRLVRAANIAGAASLSATNDVSMQRQAIREGVIDFLVTSLDEALRILKNEIRKRNGVAVGVAAPSSQVVAEMRERGVLPDLVSGSLASELADFVSQGAGIVEPAALPVDHRLVIVTLPAADFEARILALIPESDYASRRWVRLSPRYLGPQARRMRTLWCNDDLAQKLNVVS
jgi:urocanate hydratase